MGRHPGSCGPFKAKRMAAGNLKNHDNIGTIEDPEGGGLAGPIAQQPEFINRTREIGVSERDLPESHGGRTEAIPLSNFVLLDQSTPAPGPYQPMGRADFKARAVGQFRETQLDGRTEEAQQQRYRSIDRG
jgi:hypothetical protein